MVPKWATNGGKKTIRSRKTLTLEVKLDVVKHHELIEVIPSLNLLSLLYLRMHPRKLAKIQSLLQNIVR